MGTWVRLEPDTVPLDRRKLGIRSWALERMGKGLRTGRDWGSLGHLDWLWGDNSRLLNLQLRGLFLLKGVVRALSMFDTLFSLEDFCVGVSANMRSPVREMWGKRIPTKFFVVEEVFGLLSMTLDAVTRHTTLDAALTRSGCRTKNQSCCEHTRKKPVQQVGTKHEQSSHVRWAF